MTHTTPNQSTPSSTSTDSQSVIYENPENRIHGSKNTHILKSMHYQNKKIEQIRLIDAYKDLYFYFKNKYEFERYIIDVARASKFYGSYKACLAHLRKMASGRIPSGTKVYTINSRYLRIRGDHIKLFNKLLGISLSKLERTISKITKPSGRGGIKNPRFPIGNTLFNSIAGLVATALSDGHLKPNGTIEYAEPNLSRIKKVEQNLHNFGDIKLNPRFVTRDNHYFCYFSTPFGAILSYLGIQSGDKSINNPSIPDFITNGSTQQISAFFAGFVPQDGSVSLNEVSITQSTSLHPGNKINNYSNAFQLENKLIQLVIKHGEDKTNCKILSRKKLVKLMNIGKFPDSKLARELHRRVYQHPSKIVVQSVTMAKRIRVNMEAKPYAIRYFKKTGKVTVAWVVRTTQTYEMLKFAIVAPPNDVVKRKILRDALQKNKGLVNKALKELTNQGIVVVEWWK